MNTTANTLTLSGLNKAAALQAFADYVKANPAKTGTAVDTLKTHLAHLSEQSEQQEKQPAQTKKEAAKERRRELVSRSKGLQALVKEGVFASVNEGLEKIYSDEAGRKLTFNTYKGWKDKGRQVIKGERAYLFWGSPRKIGDKAKDEKPEDDKNTRTFFPISYLFDIDQTEPITE